MSANDKASTETKKGKRLVEYVKNEPKIQKKLKEPQGSTYISTGTS